MSDTDLPNSEDASPDLQAALAAAFGDEAMDWAEEEQSAETAGTSKDSGSSDDAPDMAALANMLADANSADDPGAALDDLLKKVSSAIDEGNLPEQLDADAASKDETEQETGVRPNWLRGVTNLRGQILSVTDFRNLLNLQSDRTAVGEKIIVVHSPRHTSSTALVVDRVLGIRNLNSEKGTISGLSDRVANFSDGISVTDQATTVLIDPDLLLGGAELSAFASK